ncbi:pyridoxamine 5'-phosphate oxidase [Adhaeribacter aquaticus]|uniref:pyridoxamine 5'-phosphate oxidase n=1 Tax=Adhaeribacter aquaticus TaxID=299567 RepID=UPI00041B1A72|nr:pyridoxamine 5'-phosphate oxidase [Adhaeribacter aquaticus]
MPAPFNLADIRKSYTRQELTEKSILPDPMEQFQVWLNEALQAQVEEPTAMVLSTVNQEGKPSARVVLLKGLEHNKFVFYTNYNSRKGQELAQTGFAALTFFWPELERQVRVEGTVRKVEPAQSDSYYHSRPRGSQIGAWVSPQSQPISSREALEQKIDDFEQQFSNTEVIPRPPHWGGYEVIPTLIEFWQGRMNRLHDRLVFTRPDENTNWQLDRLAP